VKEWSIDKNTGHTVNFVLFLIIVCYVFYNCRKKNFTTRIGILQKLPNKTGPIGVEASNKKRKNPCGLKKNYKIYK
jgi:hypothetical protein